ncbi:hypothetical protein RUESEDTHA_01206 [Ruegeria sp. THAF57]|uniref:hypothetical protein n=1 Tax=Ruegeria sp. THAF57 TaxID=2744555 RepID=UPI0015DDBCDB|nr:hypothetical protein [Ruegeria sp. THAF57]CAD0184327.1 hypothetical protein RUESEDTHA_01206 [Ruegeria sp. THAF57]
MELIADMLLVAGALGAGLYCFVLSRRLRRFTDLEKGVGGAVAVLSTQADELKKSLDSARAASDKSGDDLKVLTQRAETVAQQLELMMASMHDVISEEPKPETPTKTEAETAPEAPETETAPEVAPSAEASDDEMDDVQKPEQDSPAKRPVGLMFMRHGRSRGEVTG